MVREKAFQRFVIAFITSSLLAGNLTSQEKEATPVEAGGTQNASATNPSTKTKNPSTKTVPADTNPANLKSVDLKRTLNFSLTMDLQNKSTIEFSGLDQKGVIFNDTNSEKVPQLLTSEFSKNKDVDGVVIRVAKNVKYPMVNSLFENIKSSLDQNGISKPIYIAVKDPMGTPSQDEIVTREFVIKNQKAGSLYERISRVGKLLNVELRLDPVRNSITAKGATKHIAGIQRLLGTMDLKPGDASATPPKNPDISFEQTTRPPATSTPEIQPKNLPESSRVPLANRPSVKQGAPGAVPAVGKYQMSAIGNNLFLLDTSTGESWFLNVDGEEMYWAPLPHPTQK